jgi:hypothetical protein
VLVSSASARELELEVAAERKERDAESARELAALKEEGDKKEADARATALRLKEYQDAEAEKVVEEARAERKRVEEEYTQRRDDERAVWEADAVGAEELIREMRETTRAAEEALAKGEEAQETAKAKHEADAGNVVSLMFQVCQIEQRQLKDTAMLQSEQRAELDRMRMLAFDAAYDMAGGDERGVAPSPTRPSHASPALGENLAPWGWAKTGELNASTRDDHTDREVLFDMNNRRASRQTGPELPSQLPFSVYIRSSQPAGANFQLTDGFEKPCADLINLHFASGRVLTTDVDKVMSAWLHKHAANAENEFTNIARQTVVLVAAAQACGLEVRHNTKVRPGIMSGGSQISPGIMLGGSLSPGIIHVSMGILLRAARYDTTQHGHFTKCFHLIQGLTRGS